MNKTKQATRDYNFTWGLKSAALINIPKIIRAADLTKHFDDPSKYFLDIYRGKGILLYGDAGTGKSFLASAISRYYYVNFEIKIRFLDIPDFIVDIKNFDSVSNYYKDLLESELIVLDDLGSEYQTDYTVQNVGYLINKIYSNGISCIITTNMSPDEIKDKYGDRIFTRIDAMCPSKLQPTEVLR